MAGSGAGDGGGLTGVVYGGTNLMIAGGGGGAGQASMVDMVEEMVLVVEDQEVLVDQIVVEVVAKVVVEEQVLVVEMLPILEYILVPLDTMPFIAIMVGTLVVTEPIRKTWWRRWCWILWRWRRRWI